MSVDKIKEIIREYRDKRILTARFLEKINYELRHTPKFSNLNEDNRKLLFEIIKNRHEQIFLRGGLESVNIRDERRRIFGRRFEEDLTDDDRRDIADILGMFKK
jgi:hypothetical protein